MTNFEKWKEENEKYANQILKFHLINNYGVSNNKLVRCRDIADCGECDLHRTSCNCITFLNSEYVTEEDMKGGAE